MVISLVIVGIVILILVLVDILYLHRKLDESYLELNKSIFKLKDEIMIFLLEDRRIQMIKTMIVEEEEQKKEKPKQIKNQKRSEGARRMWEKRRALKSITQEPSENLTKENEKI